MDDQNITPVQPQLYPNLSTPSDIAPTPVSKPGSLQRNIVLGVLMLSLFAIIILLVFQGFGFFAHKSATKPSAPTPPTGSNTPISTLPVKTPTSSTASASGVPTYAEDFPPDVPLYPNAKVFTSSMVKDGNLTVTLAVQGSTNADITNFYKTNLSTKGWTLINDTSNDIRAVLLFTKDKRELSVTAGKGTSNGADVIELNLLISPLVK